MISHFTTLVLSSSLTRSHQVSNLNATISKYDLQILDATRKKKRTELTRVLSESKNGPVKELQVSQVSVHLWLSIVKQLFPRSFDDFFALLPPPPPPLLFRALQVQVGFGNAIALQTMFSHFYIIVTTFKSSYWIVGGVCQ